MYRCPHGREPMRACVCMSLDHRLHPCIAPLIHTNSLRLHPHSLQRTGARACASMRIVCVYVRVYVRTYVQPYVCVCVYVYMHVSAYARMYACMRAGTCACMHVCMCVGRYAWLDVCMYVPMCMHMCPCACTRVYVHGGTGTHAAGRVCYAVWLNG